MSRIPTFFWGLTPIIVIVAEWVCIRAHHIFRAARHIGAVGGLLIGPSFAALLEDYFDQKFR